jgi:hypothetical protein
MHLARPPNLRRNHRQASIAKPHPARRASALAARAAEHADSSSSIDLTSSAPTPAACRVRRPFVRLTHPARESSTPNHFRRVE